MPALSGLAASLALVLAGYCSFANYSNRQEVVQAYAEDFEAVSNGEDTLSTGAWSTDAGWTVAKTLLE